MQENIFSTAWLQEGGRCFPTQAGQQLPVPPVLSSLAFL